jgi:hypothetical protein
VEYNEAPGNGCKISVFKEEILKEKLKLPDIYKTYYK